MLVQGQGRVELGSSILQQAPAGKSLNELIYNFTNVVSVHLDIAEVCCTKSAKFESITDKSEPHPIHKIVMA